MTPNDSISQQAQRLGESIDIIEGTVIHSSDQKEPASIIGQINSDRAFSSTQRLATSSASKTVVPSHIEAMASAIINSTFFPENRQHRANEDNIELVQVGAKASNSSSDLETTSSAPEAALPNLIQALHIDAENVSEIYFPRFPHPPANADKNEPIQLTSRQFKRNYPAVGLAVIAVMTAIFASLYSWEAAMPSHTLRAMLWDNPQNTIFTINLVSHFTMQFLEILITTACDNLRWEQSRRGISLLDFTVLAGTTTWLGLLQVLFARCPRKDDEGNFWVNLRQSSYRFWSIQRYIAINSSFMLIKADNSCPQIYPGLHSSRQYGHRHHLR